MARLLRNSLLIFSVLVLTAPVVFAEAITITTYYPSPYGSYDQLGTNKLAVNISGVAVPSEYAAMGNGDAHIGRALIIGAGGGSGYAFDEGATTGDGTLLVKGKVGIGTTAPLSKLSVIGGARIGAAGADAGAGNLVVDNTITVTAVTASGTINAASFQAGGTPGINRTLNVLNGAGPCTIVVKNGVITGGTC